MKNKIIILLSVLILITSCDNSNQSEEIKLVNNDTNVVLNQEPYYTPSTVSLGETVKLIIPADNYSEYEHVFAYPSSYSDNGLLSLTMIYDYNLLAYVSEFVIEQYYPESIGLTQINFYSSDYNNRQAFFDGDFNVVELIVLNTTPDITGPGLQDVSFSEVTASIGDTVKIIAEFSDSETGIKENHGTHTVLMDNSGSWSFDLWGYYDSETELWEAEFEITADYPTTVSVHSISASNNVGIINYFTNGDEFTSPVLTIE